MRTDQAYIIKGYLIARDAPPAIMAAIDEVIDALGSPVMLKVEPVKSRSGGESFRITPFELPGAKPEEPPATPASHDSPAKLEDVRPAGGLLSPSSGLQVESLSADRLENHALEKKKRNWSPEARAAAADRMRARQAAGIMGKRQPASDTPTAAPAEPFTPVTADKLLADHDGYAGKRDPFQPLTDDDWPDIKARVAKSPDRRTIAGDYDIALDDLNFFIQSCQRREQRSGEALASPPRGASGATRKTW